MREMDVTTIGLECESDGTTRIVLWMKAWSPDDIDDVLAWLSMARQLMVDWREIRDKRSNVVTPIKKGKDT